MFKHDLDFDHYYRAGFEVAEIISESVSTNLNDPGISILDFASGYGRGARFIRSFFPKAHLHTQDVIGSANEFCRATFNCTSSPSFVEYDRLDTSVKFDVIWVGSLATHLDETKTISLLEYLSSSLKSDGRLIVSSHGSFVYRRIRRKVSYGINGKGLRFFLSYFFQGYTYRNYSGENNYGISVISPGWWRRNAKIAGLEVHSYSKRRWDAHHDVLVLTKI
jgi:hypothetical protein